MIQSYRDLLVWQKSVDLCVEVHQAPLAFPKHELFGLCAQLNRAIVSIPSNIAEGHGRRTTQDVIHFLTISRGSLNEVETQITLAMRYEYITQTTHDELLSRCGEVGRMLNGLIGSLKNRISNS